METRASYVLVGAFVLALAAAGFGFVIWLSQVRFEEPVRYVIHFSGSVTGLAVGSPVRYRGVPVGSVSDISIDPQDIERIRVIVSLSPTAPIKTDTVANLGLQGITGVAFIQLSGGTKESAALTPAKGGALAEIPSRPSGIEELLDRAPELFERGIVMLERLSKLLDDKNLASVASTLDNLQSITQTIRGETGAVKTVVANTGEAAAALRQAAADIGRLVKSLETRADSLGDSATKLVADTDKTLADIRGAANAVNKTARTLDSLVVENRPPIRAFAGEGLNQLTQFVTEARTLVAALTRLSEEIERNPSRFFFGDRQQGFEAK